MQIRTEQLIERRYLLKSLTHQYDKVELHDALDTQLDRPVTLQRLTEAAAGDALLAETFLRHQQTAASIHDCPLLTVYDAGTWDGVPFSVMERGKGHLPGALHKPGYPPDVPIALSVARQAADALRCCRESGLHDWTFALEAVSLDADGKGCLAIIEGLSGPYSSSSPETDALALAALLRLMLTGEAAPTGNSAALSLMPLSVRNLLARMEPGANDALHTAGQVAAAIGIVEEAAHQPTEAYEPDLIPEPGARSQATAVLPVVEPPWEAPTLAAPVVAPAVPGGVPYLPPPITLEDIERPRPPRRLFFLAAGSGLLLLLLLLLAALPRELPARTATSATSVVDVRTQNLAPVPDLRGKSLEEARNMVGAAGVNLAQGDPVHDASAPPDTVALQEPAPSTQIQEGSLVTVSLSLGPEPTPTNPPEVAAPEPAPPQVQPQPPQRGKGKKDKQGQDGGDD